MEECYDLSLFLKRSEMTIMNMKSRFIWSKWPKMFSPTDSRGNAAGNRCIVRAILKILTTCFDQLIHSWIMLFTSAEILGQHNTLISS